MNGAKPRQIHITETKTEVKKMYFVPTLTADYSETVRDRDLGFWHWAGKTILMQFQAFFSLINSTLPKKKPRAALPMPLTFFFYGRAEFLSEKKA